MKKVLVNQLKLGDTIQVFDGAYGHATVCGIAANGDLSLYRPFTHCANFACGDGNGGSAVICYTGLETFVIPYSETKIMDLVESRKDPIL